MSDIIICTESVDVNKVLKKHKISPAAVCKSEQELAEALTRLERMGTDQCQKFFSIKTEDGVRACPFSDIMYCTSDGHRYNMHLCDGTVLRSRNARCRFALSMESLLSDDRFIQSSHSAIVNTAYIKNIGKTHIVMYNGDRLLFSAGNAQEILQRLT